MQLLAGIVPLNQNLIIQQYSHPRFREFSGE